MTRPPAITELYELLNERLDDHDLRDLCLYLNQDYDDLGTGGRRDRLRELLIIMDKRGALGSLQYALLRLRSDLERELERFGSDAMSALSYLDIARTNMLPPPGIQHVLRNPERIYVPVRLASTPDVVEGEDGLSYLDRQLQQSGVVVAVGGYGTGKSFLAQKLFLEAAAAYQSNPAAPGRLPILFPLKRLVGRARDLVILRLIEHLQTLGLFPRRAEEGALRVEFENRLRKGDFLCILDGFDEIPLLAMRQNPAEELNALLDSLAVGSNKVVVTSRPAILSGAMFRALADQRRLTLAYLQPWTAEDHFRRYLVECARCGIDFGSHLTDFERWVLSRSELRALTSTPLYCQMLVETREQIVRRTEELNVATLYTLYTERYFVSVSERSLLHQRIFDVKKEVAYRSDCLAATATGMLREGNLRLTVEQIESALRLYAQKYDDELLGIFTKLDTLIYSLLIPDVANGYSFSHKSFFEYYVARKVVQQLEDTNETEHVIAQVLLAKEVVAFLAGLLTTRHPFAASLANAFGTAAAASEIRKLPQFSRGSAGETLFRNLAALQLELGGGVSGAALDGLDFNGYQFGSREAPAALEGVKLNQAKLESAIFVGADMRGGQFRAARLNRCSLDEADLRDADLTGAFMHDISCNRTRFVGARFRGVSLGRRDVSRILAAVHTELASDLSEPSHQWLVATEKTLARAAI